MKLETERLVLSAITMNDLNPVHELNSLPETDKYNTAGIVTDIEISRARLSEWLTIFEQTPINKYVLVIRNKQNMFIGLIGINMGKTNYKHAEIWYKIHPAQWRKGYATEAVKVVLHFCFTMLNLHRITAGCATENTASVKVLEKSGFIREGHHKKVLPIRGQWVDNFEYAILEEDFFTRK